MASFILSADYSIRKARFDKAGAADRALRRRGRPGRWHRFAAGVLSGEIYRQAQGSDIDAEAAKHLPGPPFDVQDPHEQVLRIDMRIASVKRQAGGSFDGATGSGRELRFAALSRATLANGLGDDRSCRVGGGTGRHEGRARQALNRKQSEEEVLGADMRVIKLASLLMGHLDHPTSAVTQAFHELHHTALLAAASPEVCLSS